MTFSMSTHACLEDLAELEKLRLLACRPANIAAIENLIAKSRQLLEDTKDDFEPVSTLPVQTASTPIVQPVEKSLEPSISPRVPSAPIREPIGRAKAKTQTIFITSGYGWTQSDTYVTVYLEISDAHQITLDQCVLDVQPKSVQLDIREHKGANYNFRIARLHGQIDPSQCKIKIKATKIVLFLRKQDFGKEWTDLRLKNTRDMYNQLQRAEEKGDGPTVYGEAIQNMMKTMFSGSEPFAGKPSFKNNLNPFEAPGDNCTNPQACKHK
ncbi:hypothetical protein F4703DRAFT_1825293 [Phycomyces blakesleeanus]